MRTRFLFCAAALSMALPSAQLRSQALPPPPADPFAALEAISKTNDDLLKRQEQTLKDLTDLTTTAHEARIFAKRG